MTDNDMAYTSQAVETTQLVLNQHTECFLAMVPSLKFPGKEFCEMDLGSDCCEKDLDLGILLVVGVCTLKTNTRMHI